MRAALHGHSTEAEVREILAIAVKPVTRVRLGEAREANAANDMALLSRAHCASDRAVSASKLFDGLICTLGDGCRGMV